MKQLFEIIEDFSEFKVESLVDVLDGKRPAYIVRNYLDDEELLKIKNHFLEILSRTNGGNRSKDFVPVFQVGATQFKKTTPEYIQECKLTKDNIQELLMAIDNDAIREDFLLEKTMPLDFNKQGIKFRPSQFLNDFVNKFTIRQWKNSNTEHLSLLPHEDLSQLNLAQRDDYEIGKVGRVIASNLCVSNGTGGDLIIWNYEPDFELKVSLGVENSGYPYPLSLLREKEFVELKINAGDLYFINANLIHAVKEVAGSERISAGRFMGKVSENLMVYWT